MTDRFTIELQDAELTQTLAAAIARLERPGELMDRIGALMEQNIQFRFDTKTAPDGTPWLPLAPSTQADYAKNPKWKRKTPDGVVETSVPGSLLERTRYMRNSLTHNASDSIVEVGFTDPVAIYHETGTRRGLPRRQLLSDDPIAGTLGQSDREDILAEISAYLNELL